MVLSVIFYPLLVASFGLVGFVLIMWFATLLGDLRARREWNSEGLIMHELIAPTGELQDPEFGDRRLPPSRAWRPRSQ